MVEPPTPVRSGMELTPAIAAALLVLAASFALSVGFVVANGGMNLSGGGSGSPLAVQGSGAQATETPAAASGDSLAASTEPSPEASVKAETAAPGLAATATPTLAPTESPTLAPTPAPSAAPTARPTSDRYALLTRCGNEPDCWIYVVRSGDNLVSIANYFGVPLEVVYERNPWAETTRLVAGQELRLPPPTR
jgi:hypothetical protein